MSSGQEPSGGTGTREVRGAREPSLDASPGQSFDTGRIGYHPEYSAVARALRALRQMLDTLWFEAITIIMVLVYAVILFVSLTVANSTDVDDPLCFAINTTSARREILDTNTTLAELCMITEDQDTLWWLDAIFIHLFEVEICLRALGYGYRICCDPLQAIDSVVVTASFIVLYIPSDAMAAGGNLLNLLRVIRLLRLAVIINRLHNARAAAGMRSKVRALPPAPPHTTAPDFVSARTFASAQMHRAPPTPPRPTLTAASPPLSRSPSHHAACHVPPARSSRREGARIPHRLPGADALAARSV
jgi:hypothetical protein